MCFGLESWIVSASSLTSKDVLWIGLVNRPRLEPLKKEVFQIGVVDHPRVLFQIGPAQSPKEGEVFQIGPTFFV